MWTLRYTSLCRWHRKLLLWTRASHETTSYPDDSQPASELWTVQENGDLCMFLTTKWFNNILYCMLHCSNRMWDVNKRWLFCCSLPLFSFSFHPAALFCVSETTQSHSRGDDKIPQWRLHQVPPVHTARQHVRVQQADAALYVLHKVLTEPVSNNYFHHPFIWWLFLRRSTVPEFKITSSKCLFFCLTNTRKLHGIEALEVLNHTLHIC